MQANVSTFVFLVHTNTDFFVSSKSCWILYENFFIGLSNGYQVIACEQIIVLCNDCINNANNLNDFSGGKKPVKRTQAFILVYFILFILSTSIFYNNYELLLLF